MIVLGPARVWLDDGTELKVRNSAGITIATPSRTDFDRKLEHEREDAGVDYSDWFCVRTAPYPCPAEGCDFVAVFSTAAHLIVVWPRNDDPKLLANAQNCRLAGRQPRIVEYEPGFGSCIPWDVWERLGRPVHAIAAPPSGYQDRARESL